MSSSSGTDVEVQPHSESCQPCADSALISLLKGTSLSLSATTGASCPPTATHHHTTGNTAADVIGNPNSAPAGAAQVSCSATANGDALTESPDSAAAFLCTAREAAVETQAGPVPFSPLSIVMPSRPRQASFSGVTPPVDLHRAPVTAVATNNAASSAHVPRTGSISAMSVRDFAQRLRTTVQLERGGAGEERGDGCDGDGGDSCVSSPVMPDAGGDSSYAEEEEDEDSDGEQADGDEDTPEFLAATGIAREKETEEEREKDDHDSTATPVPAVLPRTNGQHRAVSVDGLAERVAIPAPSSSALLAPRLSGGSFLQRGSVVRSGRPSFEVALSVPVTVTVSDAQPSHPMQLSLSDRNITVPHPRTTAPQQTSLPRERRSLFRSECKSVSIFAGPVLMPGLNFNQSTASMTTRPPTAASTALNARKKDGYKYLNDYRLLRTLGRGSCGKVRLAFDEVEKRQVAIKEVRRAEMRARIGGPSIAQQLYNALVREINVMKKLRHCNIVSLYEVIDDPSADKLYLVMQYVDRGVIAKVEVRANTDCVCDPIPPAQLAAYTREMLTGLQYLHLHNVVHRDLKPDNILVSKDGHAYLADFGVAETFDTSYRRRCESVMAASMAASMAMSMAGARIGGPQVLGTKGTPLFIAPELWNGTKSFGKPVDMWAMGVTLYTLLVGKLPFVSPNDITDSTFTPQVPAEFGAEWRTLIAGMLDRNPVTRWTVEKARGFVKLALASDNSGATVSVLSPGTANPITEQAMLEAAMESTCPVADTERPPLPRYPHFSPAREDVPVVLESSAGGVGSTAHTRSGGDTSSQFSGGHLRSSTVLSDTDCHKIGAGLCSSSLSESQLANIEFLSIPDHVNEAETQLPPPEEEGREEEQEGGEEEAFIHHKEIDVGEPSVTVLNSSGTAIGDRRGMTPPPPPSQRLMPRLLLVAPVRPGGSPEPGASEDRVSPLLSTIASPFDHVRAFDHVVHPAAASFTMSLMMDAPSTLSNTAMAHGLQLSHLSSAFQPMLPPTHRLPTITPASTGSGGDSTVQRGRRPHRVTGSSNLSRPSAARRLFSQPSGSENELTSVTVNNNISGSSMFVAAGGASMLAAGAAPGVAQPHPPPPMHPSDGRRTHLHRFARRFVPTAPTASLSMTATGSASSLTSPTVAVPVNHTSFTSNRSTSLVEQNELSAKVPCRPSGQRISYTSANSASEGSTSKHNNGSEAASLGAARPGRRVLSAQARAGALSNVSRVLDNGPIAHSKLMQPPHDAASGAGGGVKDEATEKEREAEDVAKRSSANKIS